MFSLMTPALLFEFEMYETPADIFNMISTWDSDKLNSTCPLIQERLRNALMMGSETVDDFFWRVKGYCTELQKAGAPVEQNYALGIIINGIRAPRFEHLRIRYCTMRLSNEPLDYWAVLKAYHDLDRINMELPSTDSRHPGWSGPSPTLPANAALPQSHRRQDGTRRTGGSKRVFDPCTWGPCKDKTTHPTHRCWTKHPEMFMNRSVPRDDTVPANFSVPSQLSKKQQASVQALIDSYALQK